MRAGAVVIGQIHDEPRLMAAAIGEASAHGPVFVWTDAHGGVFAYYGDDFPAVLDDSDIGAFKPGASSGDIEVALRTWLEKTHRARQR